MGNSEPLGMFDPCIMVIFWSIQELGKLIPALYNLAKERLLSKAFAVVDLVAAG